jgi:aminopeptidase-like protein
MTRDISSSTQPPDVRREPTDVGQAMYDLIARLYPICRSITGDGVRETLKILAQEIDLETHEVPTGTEVFDWSVPREWNVRDAYVKNSRGERVIDFRRSNLHVINYSVPVRATMTLAELRPHLHSDPEHPDWIPYRTSYYNEAWGFCLTHRQSMALEDDTYEVCIDSSLAAGHLTYGELFLEGASKDEVLVSCHVCHPSLCNDNLSGIATAVFLAKALQRRARRHSYRFLFVPGMIGPITWLARNESSLGRIKHGLVLACVGDPGRSTYKRSRQGSAEIDRVVEYVLKASNQDYEILDFSPWGYDERQYGSPGIGLSVGCLMRTPHGQFPEYHTSADDLDLVRPEALADTLDKCLRIAEILDGNIRYLNQNPKCEPQLGRRGLYSKIGGAKGPKKNQLAMLWVLNFSDGQHELLTIAERSGLEFSEIRLAADALEACGLLKPAPAAPVAAS